MRQQRLNGGNNRTNNLRPVTGEDGNHERHERHEKRQTKKAVGKQGDKGVEVKRWRVDSSGKHLRVRLQRCLRDGAYPRETFVLFVLLLLFVVPVLFVGPVVSVVTTSRPSDPSSTK